MTDKKYIHIKVRDSQKVVFEGEVDRISSFNEVGPFDIYPMHANFISIINKKLTLYKDKKIVAEMDIEKAVMKVKKDTAKIFLGIETIDFDEEGITKPPDKPSDKNLSTKPTQIQSTNV